MRIRITVGIFPVPLESRRFHQKACTLRDPPAPSTKVFERSQLLPSRAPRRSDAYAASLPPADAARKISTAPPPTGRQTIILPSGVSCISSGELSPLGTTRTPPPLTEITSMSAAAVRDVKKSRDGVGRPDKAVHPAVELFGQDRDPALGPLEDISRQRSLS